MNPKEKKIVAYHESGHALVAMSVPHVDPVNKISIIPRGIAALGYTQQLPTEDRYLMTREELMHRLYVLLGGRVAEEIIFDDVSTGAQNDLQRATDIARSMVSEYGMGSRLGLLTYTRERRPMFLDITGTGREKEYSERTAQEIDEEMATIMEEAHQKVRFILTEKRDILERIAGVLLEQEVIEGDALKQLIAEVQQGRSSASRAR
jgi:cell division protease FtsH